MEGGQDGRKGRKEGRGGRTEGREAVGNGPHKTFFQDLRHGRQQHGE